MANPTRIGGIVSGPGSTMAAEPQENEAGPQHEHGAADEQLPSGEHADLVS